MQFSTKEQSKKRGFTLLETLVAIFILAMSITAAMTVAQNGLRATFYARDRIAAYFLAEEAIEMIKNKRNENGIINNVNPGTHWLDGIVAWDGLGGPCGAPNQFSQANDCGADSYNDQLVSCDNFNDCLLYKNLNTGIFQHSANAGNPQLEPTKFSRIIKMEKVNDNEAKITVTVNWSGRSFVVTENILNWHPLSDEE